jgi:hypothetical protein
MYVYNGITSNDKSFNGNLCLTHIPEENKGIKLQFDHGEDVNCNSINPSDPTHTLPNSGIITNVSSELKQVMFYWGNEIYGTKNSGFNPPYNIPGNLYKCELSQLSPAICKTNTTILIDNYINSFIITPTNKLDINHIYKPGQYYLYNISIIAESNVALSKSAAFSIHVPYNSNINGVNAIGNAGQIIGNNILKNINASIFLRNIYYGN